MREYRMTCRHCGKKTISFSNQYCSVDCHFLHYVPVGEKNNCWNWKGILSETGYGRFNIGREFIAAYRFSYIFYKGEIPEDKIVRHTCDNPACVNPNHLILGSYSDNNNDMMERDRHPAQARFPYFQKHSKECMEKIWSLRESGMPYQSIADQENLSIGTVYYLCKKAQGINYKKERNEKKENIN